MIFILILCRLPSGQMLQVCGYCCASVFESRVNEKTAGRGKKKTQKQIKHKPPAKWANVHGCCCTSAEEVWKPTFFFSALCGNFHTPAQHIEPSVALREAWSRRVRRFGPSTSGESGARPQRGCWRGSDKRAASCWGTATRCRASTVCVWGELWTRPNFMIIVLLEHFACIVGGKLLTWKKLELCLQPNSKSNSCSSFTSAFWAVWKDFRYQESRCFSEKESLGLTGSDCTAVKAEASRFQHWNCFSFHN